MRDWAHVIASTRGTWLPGDGRGFRNRRHRIHSTGDYKHRPPAGEHDGLEVHTEALSSGAIVLTPTQRERVGAALIEKLDAMRIEVAALCCADTHAHALIRIGVADAVTLFGRVKQFASHRVRDEVPGKLWAASSQVVRIRDRAHFGQTKRYILGHAEEGAWVWSEGAKPESEGRRG